MRVFKVRDDGTFNECVQTPFQLGHEEAVLEKWLEANPEGMIQDETVLIIGRQVATNLGSFIDLLAIDRDGDTVVIELKRDRTPRDTLAQSLEYASYVQQLDADQLETILRKYLSDESLSLAQHHRTYFALDPEEAVSFNKRQRIVVVGQEVTPQIRQTAEYLSSKGLPVTCLEFSFFESDEGTKLLSQEVVVGKEAGRIEAVSTGSLPLVTEEEFLKSLDDNGRPFFTKILEYATQQSMPIHWGTKGFSLNVNLNGTHVAVCFGYPPSSVYKQSLYTALVGRGGLHSKTAAPDSVIDELVRKAKELGHFVLAGRELKCQIDKNITEKETSAIIEWIGQAAREISNYGLRE
jgi:hypothetical protein